MVAACICKSRRATRSRGCSVTLHGRAHEMGLGPVGDPPDAVPLAKVRTLASEARALLRQGRDPLAERQAERAGQRQAAADATPSTAPSGSPHLRRTPIPSWATCRCRQLALLTCYGCCGLSGSACPKQHRECANG